MNNEHVYLNTIIDFLLFPELAVQTFEVMKNVGKLHDFSAGLVVGGNDFAKEQKSIQRM